jgi:methyl-accepting chemotaxis protein
MRPITFSNAIVATVSAYAEALSEQAQLVEQMQAALKQAAQTKEQAHSSQDSSSVVAAARAVVRAAARQNPEQPPSHLLLEALHALGAVLRAFDGGPNEGG